MLPLSKTLNAVLIAGRHVVCVEFCVGDGAGCFWTVQNVMSMMACMLKLGICGDLPPQADPAAAWPQLRPPFFAFFVAAFPSVCLHTLFLGCIRFEAAVLLLVSHHGIATMALPRPALG